MVIDLLAQVTRVRDLEIPRTCRLPLVTTRKAKSRLTLFSWKYHYAWEHPQYRQCLWECDCWWAPLATLDYTSDPVQWGNATGLSLLERFDRHDAELQSLRKSLEMTRTMVTDLDSEVSSIKLEMVTLKQESGAYLTLRNPFFATFRRDFLQSVPDPRSANSILTELSEIKAVIKKESLWAEQGLRATKESGWWGNGDVFGRSWIGAMDRLRLMYIEGFFVPIPPGIQRFCFMKHMELYERTAEREIRA